MSLATIAPFVNFAILLAILIFLGRKPLQQMFAKNRLDFEEKRNLAKEAIERSEKQYNEFKSKWDNLSAEVQEIKTKSLESLKKESDELTQNATKMANFIKQEAEKTANVEIDLARKEISKEIMDAVTKKFSEELKSNSSKGIHQNILDNAISATKQMEV